MDGKVSIIIPVYNRQVVVKECVQSILAQSYENFEIIFIDDGSSDQTLSVCREMAEQDDRILVLKQNHSGVSAARNVGLEAASGEYVFFVDSDDVINPRLIETLVLGMKNSDAAMAASDTANVREQYWHFVQERITEKFDLGETTYKTHEEALHAAICTSSPLGRIGGVMMRRDLIGDTRFREDLFIGEDFYFIYENLLKGTGAVFLKPNWYYARLHENNISWNYGYEGFYTRFLRHKLVWESEETFGRIEHVKHEKKVAVWNYYLCSRKEGVSKEDLKKMRETMKQHRKELVPALPFFGKLEYYLSVYASFFYAPCALVRKLKSTLSNKKKSPQSLPVNSVKENRGNISVVENPEHIDLLKRFLGMSVSATDEVFSAFEDLPGAITGRGETNLERFVYVPGSRKDRILLVAHADTVWDCEYGRAPSDTDLGFEDGVFFSKNPQCGIGADDRAGCAMLYALRNCGHSLLLVGGEERGKKGAWFLRKHKPKLFKELNRHKFMIELDWCGTNSCLFNQVDYTDKFKNYIENTLGVRDSQMKGGCDLYVLCHKVCGVNVGVGYHNYHLPKETLVLKEWENTYNAMTSFLEKKHPRFPIDPQRRLVSNIKRLKSIAYRVLKPLISKANSKRADTASAKK